VPVWASIPNTCENALYSIVASFVFWASPDYQTLVRATNLLS